MPAIVRPWEPWDQAKAILLADLVRAGVTVGLLILALLAYGAYCYYQRRNP